MDYFFLSETILFRGTTPEEVQTMLGCLNAEKKTYRRGNIIYSAGDSVTSIGLVLSGCVSIENDDIWGNRTILDMIGPGEIFAETYACVPGEPLMITAAAAEDSEILFLDVSRVLAICSNNCVFHGKLIRNLLTAASQKNLNLSRRIFHTSSKSIRGRLLSYLSFQAKVHGNCDFTIPFNRQQLADYLSVDRSAMSNELSKMQREGILSAQRSHFILTETDDMKNF